ncbi:MAG TPA: prolyl oligopeptidase family serine peptidase [Woeseiaceae bacterium]|nr:prolyl oligopeptidase family serine peptidase [Woeseiaceae bacterium]
MTKFTAIPALLGSFLGIAFSGTVFADEQNQPYPLEYFALREVMSNVTVSPNGNKLAMLRILTRDGNPILHIYDADKLDGEPFVVNSDPMEILSYYWASDEFIVLTLRQKVRDKIEGQNQGVYEFRIAILDVQNKKFDNFDAASPAVENLLPNKPNKIIISEQPGAEEDLSLREAFRPRAYYEMDLRKGTKKLLIRGRIDLAQISFDKDGNPRFGRGFERSTQDSIFYYRDVGEKSWREILRIDENDWGIWHGNTVLGVDPSVPGNVLVLAHNGHDKQGLWSFNTKTKTFDELIYRRNDVDVYGVRFHSNSWEEPDTITAVSYFKDKFYFEYFNDAEGALFNQLEGLIPNSHYVTVPSRSRDGNTFIIRNRGPKDPGSYYLYKDAALLLVGSEQPLVDQDKLADVQYITYEARDGRKIPAFLTVPSSGTKPYPLIVLPHGGPHVREVVLYDEWAQMLANNGYMVLQPQYRMSMGYGMDHFLSAFIDGSQGGRAMQDDKDDGAMYLVEQGYADPDRMAMFGWSYGGYAALVAASRTPQLYQCVIAGAAVADYRRQANEYGGGSSGTSKIWTEVYQYNVVEPVEEVPKVNVPILLVHGSVDQRVRPRQAKLYLKQLEKFKKPYKFVELDGADHFYNTLYFDHQLKLYESMIDFLANDCGLGDQSGQLNTSKSAE